MSREMSSGIHEDCGVFGIYNKKASVDLVNTTYFALYALQHRGQESCGIAVNNAGVIKEHKDLGLVPEVFGKEELERLGEAQMAVGHVRYSASGAVTRANAQPIVIRHVRGPLVLANNGSLVNARILKEELEMRGAIFHTTSDTEVIPYVITEARLTRETIEQAVEAAMYKLKGAYSLVMMSAKKLIAARDPNGFRPLCMGRLGDSVVFASESCALGGIGAKFERDILPGEIVVVEDGNVKSIRTHCGNKGSICVFEYVYFARPDSVIEGAGVHRSRVNAGAFLALEHPVQADVVIGVPDSGLDAALGFSRQSGIPYGVGFIKNRYVGRTFINPDRGDRDTAVRIKLNPLASTVENKRVVLIDDSIVRGTTSARIVRQLREAGATEVHMRVSSPPFISPCYFGTDIDSKEKLIACRMSLEEIRKTIDADSLGFLSVDSVQKVAAGTSCGFCSGCFTGEYPIDVSEGAPSSETHEIFSATTEV